MKQKQKPLIALTWKDAHGSATAAFSEHEIPHAAITITTYGLLVRQDAAGVTVASEECADGTFRGVTFVPAEIILSIVELGPPKKLAGTRSRGNGSTARPSKGVPPVALEMHCTESTEGPEPCSSHGSGPRADDVADEPRK